MSNFEVFRGDVEFIVETGKAKLGIEELRAQSHAALGGMSDDALRLGLAQNKLDLAIARHGPSSRAATQATLAYRRELASLTTSTREATVASSRATGAFAAEGAEINRLGRGALVGSGLVRGLGRAAAFSSTAFLGGAGLVFAIRQATNAAQEHAVREGQLRTAVTAAGISYQAYRSTIDEAIAAQERLGFSEADSIAGFTKLLVATQDVERAQRLQGLAADIARKFNVSLAVAANAVARAVGGQTSALRRIDPSIKAGISSAKALQQAEHDLAGSAEDYAKRAAGAHDRAATAIRHEEILIGQGLIPVRRRLDEEIATYLGKASNQRKIQEDVNKAIKDGTAIVHGLVDAERLVAPPIEAIVHALGGLESAVETALVLGIVLKARKAVLAFGLIQAASTKTAAVIAADSLAEQAALERTAAVAAGTSGVVGRVAAYTGAAAAGAAAAGGAAAGGASRGGSRLPIIGNPLVIGLALAGWAEIHGLSGTGAKVKATGTFAGHPAALEGGEITVDAGGGYSITYNPKTKTFTQNFSRGSLVEPSKTVAAADAAKRLGLTLAQLQKAVAPAAKPRSAGARERRGVPASASGSAQDPSYLTPAQRRANALALNPDDLTSLRDQRDYDKRSIASLQRRFAARKIDAATYSKEIQQIGGDLASTESTIQGIEQAAASKVADARRRREEARRKREAAARAAAAKTARDYRTGLSTEAQTLQNEVLRERKAGRAQTHVITTSTGGVRITGPAITTATGGPGERNLIAFYRKEAHDKRLTENERARYAHLALTEEDRATKAIATENKRRAKLVTDRKKVLADKLRTESDLGDALLQNALSLAQLHETQAGTNAAALKKARGEELRALQAQLAQERVEEKALAGKGNELARQQKIGEELATRSAITQLQQQTNPPVDRGANERQFLAAIADIRSKYEPNAFPVPSNAKLETHLFNAVHELRQQTRALTGLIGHDAFPASRYADSTAAAAAG